MIILGLPRRKPLCITDHNQLHKATVFAKKSPTPVEFDLILYIEHLQYRIISSSTREFKFLCFDTYSNHKTVLLITK